jgi:hypothetical protein
MVLLIGHPAYIMGFGIPIVAVFLIGYHKSLRRPWAGSAPIVSGAFVLALGISAYRLVPVIDAIANEGSFFTTLQGLPMTAPPEDLPYLAMPAWMSGVLGMTFYDGSSILGALGISHNVQIDALTHFGVLPILLIALAAFHYYGRKAFIAVVCLALAL